MTSQIADLSGNSSRGFLIPIGGAESRSRRPAVLRHFVELCGGSGAHVGIIPTASELHDTGSRYEMMFRDLGADRATVLPIKSRDDCDSQDYLDQLDEVDGVFMTGGDQVRLSRTLSGTPVAQKLLERNAQGLHVAGTSAGAAVMSQCMIAGGDSGLVPRRNMVELSEGLGLTTQLIFDQHFNERDRRGRLLAAIAQNPHAIGVGVDENTAAFIGPRNRLEVVGSGSVTIIDPAGLQQHFNPDSDHLGSMAGLCMHILVEGSVYDIETRTAHILPSREDTIASSFLSA